MTVRQPLRTIVTDKRMMDPDGKHVIRFIHDYGYGHSCTNIEVLSDDELCELWLQLGERMREKGLHT